MHAIRLHYGPRLRRRTLEVAKGIHHHLRERARVRATLLSFESNTSIDSHPLKPVPSTASRTSRMGK